MSKTEQSSEKHGTLIQKRADCMKRNCLALREIHGRKFEKASTQEQLSQPGVRISS